MNGVKLTQVNKCRYLGVILADDSSESHDVDRVTNSFFRQFNGMYSKFNFAHRNVLYYLFKSFTSSFYGIDVWFGKVSTSHLNKISVAYHKAVKRICGMNVWDSNHVACETVGVPIFRHLFATRLLCFWHRLCRAESECTADLKYYFKYNSHIRSKLCRMSDDIYSVDISQNPLCAIKARIGYVQRTEPRSFYVT